jgi:hemerythrin superfamily protein
MKECVMARATTSRSSDSPQDAVALLKQDHRGVEALFEEFEDADESEQSSLAARICQMLTVHAQIEEEILYPAAKQAFEEEEDDDLVNEAEVEHSTAKELIAKIEGMTPEDEHFKATVKVLSEYIKHHVKEEEGELFPKLKRTELDLKDMGLRGAHLPEAAVAHRRNVRVKRAPERGSPRHAALAPHVIDDALMLRRRVGTLGSDALSSNTGLALGTGNRENSSRSAAEVFNGHASTHTGVPNEEIVLAAHLQR